jgi:Zn-dependent M32 family carboxypeptidase
MTNTENNNINIHKNIILKMDNYILNNNIPNIIFHGPTGSGKKFIINNTIEKLYNKSNINYFVMYVNCAHGKGIKFIREELKHFSKTNILNINNVNFKTVVLVNADKLTIDAQSALRRCIELFSHTTRFFISVENINKLLKPILSRFCDIYVSRPKIRGTQISLYKNNIKTNGPFFKNTLKHLLKIKKCISCFDKENDNIVDYSLNLYEKGFSGENIISCIKIHTFENISQENIDELVFIFYKIKREFRNEKTLILFIINFLFFRSNIDLENIAFN